MALNFDKIISESENVSLEDLSIESLVQTDLDPSSITFNDLFEDHLSALRSEINTISDELTEDCLFDLDVECTDLQKNCDLMESFHFDNINLDCFDPYESNNSIDNDLTFVNDDTFTNEDIFVNGSESKKNSTIIRRQSTRIENQTRKKIAEQIQRENVRLAMEAQFLNNKDYAKKKSNVVNTINGKPQSPGMERYLAMPTDLDADEEEENEAVNNAEVISDDDPNKLWCICRQPYGDRFMICCDNCLEWYHGDCVGVTQQEGANMDEFICTLCETNSSANETPKKTEEIVIIDDEEDDDQELLDAEDDDCLITKSVEPMKFSQNIFQLLNKSQNLLPDKEPLIESPKMNLSSLSRRTSVCLNQACKTLVNPKKSLYCSRNCIDKYTKMVIKNNLREKSKQYGLPKGPKLAKMTRFVLAQPATDTIQDEFAAPTEDNLKDFLIKNPTYKVYQSTKPVKTKQDQEKSKKFLELINNDPSKHIKIVKHFATLFKKSMVLKSFNSEFKNIWQHCVKIEEKLYESCDKLINDKYMLKVKELSEHLKKQDNQNKLCWDILHDKLSISDLISFNKNQLEERMKIIVLDDQQGMSTDKTEVIKKTFVTNKGGISLLSDTTHLHGRHLYDINCKVCKGSQRSSGDQKTKDKEPMILLENPIPSCTESSNNEKLPSPSTNDEFKVSSSVETPDMAVDMEICSTSSDIDDSDCKISHGVSVDTNVDSSSVNKKKSNEMTNVTKVPKRKLKSLWEGNVTYKDVGSVMCKSYLVTRFLSNTDTDNGFAALPENDDDVRLELDLSSSLDNNIFINGRSQLSETQGYLHKLRRHSNKEFIILRLHPSNLDEGGQVYRSMFEFFHGRERCGVISEKRLGVKDCFIYPLNAHSKIPSIFLPFIGPGLEKRRPHLLLLLIVRTPLINMQYQPISPKYDQEHEFVNKHGINLDKYYPPNQNLPFCPSNPVVVKDISDSVNVKEKEKLDYESECLTKNDCETPVNTCELGNSKDVPECNGTKVIENIKDVCDKIVNIKAITEIKDLEEKNIIITTKKSIPKKAVDNCDKAAISGIPIIDILDIPLPEQTPEILPPPVVICRLPPPSDPSLCPQPFIYRSHVTKPVTTTTSINQQCQSVDDRDMFEIKIPENTSKSNLSQNYDNNQERNEEARNESFCEDVDFRFNSVIDSQILKEEHEEQLVKLTSCLYLKRKHSDRLYTYYDSFNNELDSSTKRRRYFFNPRYPTPIQDDDGDDGDDDKGSYRTKTISGHYDIDQQIGGVPISEVNGSVVAQYRDTRRT